MTGCAPRTSIWVLLTSERVRARHLVDGTHEQRHEPNADGPGRPGEEHPDHGSRPAWKLRRVSSSQTEIEYSL